MIFLFIGAAILTVILFIAGLLFGIWVLNKILGRVIVKGLGW